MPENTETLEAEIVDDFNAPVLKSAKELTTLVNVDDLVNKYKELSEIDINLPVEKIGEKFLDIEKGFKAFRNARTSLEKKRKEIGEPAFSFHKRVIEIAKEIQAKINPYEDKLKALIDKVETDEKRKQLEAEMKEAERIEEIKGFIETLKNTPMNFFNSPSVKIMEQIQSLKVPEEKYFQEFLDEAIEVHKVSMSQLESMYDTKVKAEGAEEAERIRQEQIKAEDAEREEAQRKEREEFEREKAEFKRQQDVAAQEEQQRREAESLRLAEIESQELMKRQEAERKERLEREEAERKEREEREEAELQERIKKDAAEREAKITETLEAMNKYTDNGLLLNEIIDGAIPNLKWEV